MLISEMHSFDQLLLKLGIGGAGVNDVIRVGIADMNTCMAGDTINNHWTWVLCGDCII